jgi:hypothetical protein
MIECPPKGGNSRVFEMWWEVNLPNFPNFPGIRNSGKFTDEDG